MEDQIRAELKAHANEGRISCSDARALAERLGASYAAVGQAANELGIKIKQCELGCF